MFWCGKHKQRLVHTQHGVQLQVAELLQLQYTPIKSSSSRMMFDGDGMV